MTKTQSFGVMDFIREDESQGFLLNLGQLDFISKARMKPTWWMLAYERKPLRERLEEVHR